MKWCDPFYIMDDGRIYRRTNKGVYKKVKKKTLNSYFEDLKISKKKAASDEIKGPFVYPKSNYVSWAKFERKAAS